MLAQLIGAVTDPSRRGPRLALRLALFFAVLGLLWTVLVAGMVFMLFALEGWLGGHMGKWAALAIAGLSGGLVAMAGLSLLARRGPGRGLENDLLRQRSLEAATLALQRHPLEAVTLAVTAGLLASRLDGATLARPLLALLVRPRS